SSAVVLHDEGDPVALVQSMDAGCLQRTRMDEYVLAAVFRLDESETLGGVEKLHRSVDSHLESSFPDKDVMGRPKGPHVRPGVSEVGKGISPKGVSGTADHEGALDGERTGMGNMGDARPPHKGIQLNIFLSI